MAVRDDFAAGEVLAAADLNDTFSSKVDYALPVNAQTGTTYTFVAADAEKLTTASNGSAVTLTIPPASSVAWPDETILRVVNYGAGAVTIDGGSGVTVTNTSSTIAQYGAAVAIRTGSDAWTVVPFGGGDIPAATVSSPAATGQYTDTGITYDYYTFTSSGSLTVDVDGYADVLVVGGGGGATRRSGLSPSNASAGGAGNFYSATVFIPAGTYTVTIGAGGAGVSSSTGSNGQTSEIVGLSDCKSGGGGGGYATTTGEADYSGHGSGFSGGQVTGTVLTRANGGGAGGLVFGSDNRDGRTNDLTGSSNTYSVGGLGTGNSDGAANTGNGGDGSTSGGGKNGGSGVVIVRVKV